MFVSWACLTGCGQSVVPDDSGADSVDVASTGADANDVAFVDAAHDGVTPMDDAVDSRNDVMPRDSGVSCNATLNDGTFVIFTPVTGNPPSATGGTIVPGHYVLTYAAIYGPPSPPPYSLKEAIELSGSTFDAVNAADLAGLAENRATADYSVSGTTMTFASLCGMIGEGSTTQYSVGTTNQITLITTSLTGVTVFTFTVR